MNLICYVEHTNGKLSKTAYSTISAALQMKSTQGYSKVVGCLLGSEGVSAAAEAISEFGLDEVISVSDSSLQNYLAANYALALKEIIEKFGAKGIVGLSSAQGKDLFPRLAKIVGGIQASDCLQVLPDGQFKRPMFAGNIIATVKLNSEIKVITVRATAFEPAHKGGTKAVVSSHTISFTPDTKAQFVSYESSKSERPELTEAEVIVSGGRALKSEEGFNSVLSPLADLLNAAIGASRAAVDAGYAPNDWQVGQTGKVVAPKLYIAVGISGAIQHLAGMKDSKVIVAINKDAECPMMEMADYALVGDLFQIVPELVEAIRAVKHS
jgi:electron transfer flavoprotein alpha subunit